MKDLLFWIAFSVLTAGVLRVIPERSFSAPWCAANEKEICPHG